MKKLYNVPRGTLIKVVEDPQTIAPDSAPTHVGEVLRSRGVDGMYCRCVREADGTVVYLAAWTHVEVMNEA